MAMTPPKPMPYEPRAAAFVGGGIDPQTGNVIKGTRDYPAFTSGTGPGNALVNFRATRQPSLSQGGKLAGVGFGARNVAPNLPQTQLGSMEPPPAPVAAPAPELQPATPFGALQYSLRYPGGLA